MTKADLEIRREKEKLILLQQIVKDQQKKIAKAKMKKQKEIEEDYKKIGAAITSCFPEILNLMHKPGFNIFEFVKTDEFQKAFYLKFVVGRPASAPGWTRGEWVTDAETNFENDDEEDEPVLDDSASEKV